ncbi:phospholipase D-like domain-containing protein [Pollutibacter soli]|uniref:phospholipase D-like domain-containing protein n=1 Tax=Pollutibacter soli TaxID=3034157 RepID=UPI0030132265
MVQRRGRKKQEVYTTNNRVKLIRGGKEYFNLLLQLIAAAKKQVHVQVYIFEEDTTGRMIADALKEAAQKGVEVHLLVDGYASSKLKQTFLKEMTDAGVHLRFFNPLFKGKNFYFGRRMHHKIAVADAEIALVTGVNITDRYNDMPDHPAWLDFAVWLEGDAALDLCNICWSTWNNYLTPAAPADCSKVRTSATFPEEENSSVSVRRNDWVRRKNEISFTYIDMLRRAEKQVVILCSYFLPGKQIRRQMSNATKRGVKITVITAGISDIILAKYAERYLYAWMLRNNVQIYEYQPRILHGKIAVADSSWLTVGSYNINNLSAYASIELNLNIRQEKLAKETEEMLLTIAEKECIPITDEYLRKSDNILVKFGRWSSFQILRFLLYLFTFYFKHQR